MALTCRIWFGLGNLSLPESRENLVPGFFINLQSTAAAAPFFPGSWMSSDQSLSPESAVLDRSLT